MSNALSNSSELQGQIPARVVHGPRGLCDFCELIEFDDDFQRRDHIFSRITRSVSHILLHQDCAFCWLTRQAITKPDVWDSKDEKWLITIGNFSGHLSFNVFELKKALQDCLRNIPSCVLGFEILDTPKRPDYFLSTVAPYMVQLLAPEYSHHQGRTKNSTYWRYYDFVGFKPSLQATDQAVLDYLPDNIFCARPITPLIDYGLLKGWLQLCHNLHVEKCRPAPLTPKERAKFRFRLIDVQKECIIDAPTRCEYTCLSYVWGKVQQPRLTATTFEKFYQAKALSFPRLDLPDTIRDAIIFCKEMRFGYLWCDSLCIVQDDPEDLLAHINSMDTRYRCATLTIVAAAGPDANSGLPGVRRPRKVTQNIVMVKGYELTTVPELPTFAIENSVWSRRAWTYQERRLSHRMIGFLPEQTYFCCQSTDTQIPIYEATVHDCDSRRPHTSEMVQQPPRSGRKHKIGKSVLGDMLTYTNMVEEYTARELTYESDILNAFSGMMASFDGLFNGRPNEWIFGMPTAALGWCLCWESAKERPPSPGDVVWHVIPAPTTRRLGYPSWSWAGWKTRVCMGAHHSPDAHARNTMSLITNEKDVESGILSLCAVNQRMHEEYGFHVAPHGTEDACDLQTGILKFTTSCAMLRVARGHTNEKGSRDPNKMRYRLTLPEDHEVHLGFIALDATWRDQAPDLLSFIVIHAVDPMRSTRRWYRKQKQRDQDRTSRSTLAAVTSSYHDQSASKVAGQEDESDAFEQPDTQNPPVRKKTYSIKDKGSSNSSDSDEPLFVPPGMRVERVNDCPDGEEGDDGISDIQIYLMCVEWIGGVAYRIQMAGGVRSPQDWMKAKPVERLVLLG